MLSGKQLTHNSKDLPGILDPEAEGTVIILISLFTSVHGVIFQKICVYFTFVFISTVLLCLRFEYSSNAVFHILCALLSLILIFRQHHRILLLNQ
jgi:hypothetical protein